MDASLAISFNGLSAADRRQEVIANNLSNLQTPGFRARIVDQADLQSGSTRITDVRQDLVTVGAPQQTGQDTDFYIAGRGFFAVQVENGVAYTRAGNFSVDPEGTLVSPSGHVLEPQIQVPPERDGLVTLQDGTVIAIVEGEEQVVGQIDLFRFPNSDGLKDLGGNLFLETDGSGPPIIGTPGQEGMGAIVDQTLEGANVDPTEEVSELLVNQRYQQLNLRVFQTADALVGRAIDLQR